MRPATASHFRSSRAASLPSRPTRRPRRSRSTLGAIERAAPFTPVLRGMLLTGAEPRYLRRAAARTAPSSVSEVSFAPLWWPPGKIAGRYLTPYLAQSRGSRADRVDACRPCGTGRERGVTTETRAEEEREAIDLSARDGRRQRTERIVRLRRDVPRRGGGRRRTTATRAASGSSGVGHAPRSMRSVSATCARAHRAHISS